MFTSFVQQIISSIKEDYKRRVDKGYIVQAGWQNPCFSVSNKEILGKETNEFLKINMTQSFLEEEKGKTALIEVINMFVNKFVMVTGMPVGLVMAVVLLS